MNQQGNSIANIAKDLKLDASVSFDDLVNIAVSKYETALHERRTEIQARNKACENERKKVVDDIIKHVAGHLEVAFPDRNDVGSLTIQYKIEPSTVLGDNFLNRPFWYAEVTQTTTIKDGANVMFSQYSNSGEQKLVVVNSFNAVMPVPNDFVQLIADNKRDAEVCRQDLLAVNAELQGIERKTRQVKGLLAEKKLQDAGLSGLLDSPEIANILQLPAPSIK